MPRVFAATGAAVAVGFGVVLGFGVVVGFGVAVGAGVDIDIPVIERITLNGQDIAGYSPKANSYSFYADKEKNQTLEWSIPAGKHCYGNIGMTVRTSAFSSVTLHGGVDFYDKVWRSYVLGARFNYTF